MRSLLGVLAALLVSCTWLACGSSEEDGRAKRSTGAAAARPAKPARPAGKREATAEQTQGLMDMVVWPDAGQTARDKVADGDACSVAVAEDAKLQKGVHALVKVHAWMKCMEGNGWKRKKTG